MKRRKFLGGLATTAAAGVAGCSGLGGGNGEDEDESTTTEEPETAVQYFFEDETGALGPLTDQEPELDETRKVVNQMTEQEYREFQTNDTEFASRAIDGTMRPIRDEDGESLDYTVEEMIDRAEEVYNNPKILYEEAGPKESRRERGINLEDEPDEHRFTRAIIFATMEAGVTSSGGANNIAPNIAEAAVEEIQPDFLDETNNYKLSTLRSSESVLAGPNERFIDKDSKETLEYENGYEETKAATGFRHPMGLLQYDKNGETHLKYVEVTDSISADLFYPDSIRDPEESLYRESTDAEYNGTENRVKKKIKYTFLPTLSLHGTTKKPENSRKREN